jgi:hypothetical protein
MDPDLTLCNELWIEYKACNKNADWSAKPSDDKLAHFRGNKRYSAFITKYPIPMRYMFRYNEYASDAFRKYLIRLKTLSYKSKEEWAMRQADYVKLLWQYFNPKASAQEAADQWQYAKKSICDETESFQTDYEKAKVRADEQKAAISVVHKEILTQYVADNSALERLEALREAIESAPTGGETDKEPEMPTPAAAPAAAPAKKSYKKQMRLAQEEKRKARLRDVHETRKTLYVERQTHKAEQAAKREARDAAIAHYKETERMFRHGIVLMRRELRKLTLGTPEYEAARQAIKDRDQKNKEQLAQIYSTKLESPVAPQSDMAHIFEDDKKEDTDEDSVFA